MLGRGFVARFNWTFSCLNKEHKLKQDTSKSTHRSHDTVHIVVTEDRSYQGCPQQSIPTRLWWREYSRGHLCSPWGEQSIAVHILHSTTKQTKIGDWSRRLTCSELALWSLGRTSWTPLGGKKRFVTVSYYNVLYNCAECEMSDGTITHTLGQIHQSEVPSHHRLHWQTTNRLWC